jgi:hypothetical protein
VDIGEGETAWDLKCNGNKLGHLPPRMLKLWGPEDPQVEVLQSIMQG